jgi:hypothetical protein
VKGNAMKRTWIILLAVAVALAIALPAGAKKPDKPDKPGTGFSPVACEVDEAFTVASVRSSDVTLPHIFEVTPPREFVLMPYTVDPTAAYEGPDDILCAEVRVTSGTLSDLRVRWIDYLTNLEGGCELAWARGKELSKINNDAVFAVGLSLENWSVDGGLCGAVNDDDGGDMTVVVMPKAKSAGTQVMVTIGIDHPEEG